MIRPPSPQEADQLRAFFTEHRFTEEGLLRLFRIVESPSPRLRNLPRLLDTTREPDVLNTMARWFVLNVPVASKTAAALLPGWFLEVCQRTGILTEENGSFVSPVFMVPVGSFFVASDPYQLIESPAGFGYVLTISPAARSLMDFTVRRPSRTTLDLCAGGGIHALAAAQHSEQVVATDLNPRATAFATFNAALNECATIRCLTGDGYSAVEGRTFDLIVSNPPFILAPAKQYLYRDNDMELDRFCRELTRQAPRYLNEGGYFQMICEWVEIEGETWTDRIASWFEGTGCDAWVLKDYTQVPSWYIQTRIQETPIATPEADAAAFEVWMEYYRRHKVRAIHGGFIAMRRRPGTNWVRIEELKQRADGPFGDAILRGFAARDFLESNAADEELLESRLRLAPEVLLQQRYHCEDGHWRTRSIVLELGKGLPRTTPLEGDIAEFLARFDGARSLRELVRDVAAAAGGTVDPARVASESLRIVRRLIEQGILIP